MLDLLLIEWVIKMKPGSNSIEDHPQLGHGKHTVAAALVGVAHSGPSLKPIYTTPRLVKVSPSIESLEQ
jgi:hypothetical protein